LTVLQCFPIDLHGHTNQPHTRISNSAPVSHVLKIGSLAPSWYPPIPSLCFVGIKSRSPPSRFGAAGSIAGPKPIAFPTDGVPPSSPRAQGPARFRMNSKPERGQCEFFTASCLATEKPDRNSLFHRPVNCVASVCKQTRRAFPAVGSFGMCSCP
jgi:hypothetical protein